MAGPGCRLGQADVGVGAAHGDVLCWYLASEVRSGFFRPLRVQRSVLASFSLRTASQPRTLNGLRICGTRFNASHVRDFRQNPQQSSDLTRFSVDGPRSTATEPYRRRTKAVVIAATRPAKTCAARSSTPSKPQHRAMSSTASTSKAEPCAMSKKRRRDGERPCSQRALVRSMMGKVRRTFAQVERDADGGTAALIGPR